MNSLVAYGVDWLRCIRDVLWLPTQWRGRLQRGTLSGLLDEIDHDTRPAFHVSANTIVTLVRWRVLLSRAWRRNRCLLGGLLLYRLLPCAGHGTTLVIGCDLRGTVLRGHCWIEAPGVKLGRFGDGRGYNSIHQRGRPACRTGGLA